MGTTRYDDFTRPMDPGLAVNKINAAFGGVDPHDHAGAGRGGTIPGSAISGAVATATHATSADSANNGVPVGTLFPYAGPSVPTGYLLCYGQAVSRTTYSALFTVIGTTYGAGNGSTTFNVPDMRGRVAIGLDNMGGTSANVVTNANADILGGKDGREKHALTADENGPHAHSIGISGGDDAYSGYADCGAWYYATLQTSSSGNGTPHNNMQPWIALNYIIKY